MDCRTDRRTEGRTNYRDARLPQETKANMTALIETKQGVKKTEAKKWLP